MNRIKNFLKIEQKAIFSAFRFAHYLSHRKLRERLNLKSVYFNSSLY